MNERSLVILVVGNCKGPGASWRPLLERFPDGAEVLETPNGEEGVYQALTRRPDCVLLDFRLPDMTCIDFLMLIQDDLGHVSVPVVVAITPGYESVAVEALRQGARDFVVLGEVDAQALHAVIDGAIARQRVEDELVRRASLDSLTHLPNRRMLQDHIAVLFERGLGESEPCEGLLFIDLDDFKLVNDRYGHSVGDQVLQECAARMRAAVRPGDVVARVGGDEFVALIRDVRNEREVQVTGERILAALVQPLAAEACPTLRVGASIGGALLRPELRTAESAMTAADEAMYRAKVGGKARVVVRGLAQADGTAYAMWEEELDRAIASGELRLYYQPMLEPRAGGVVAREALLRWHHPRHGILPAGRFLPQVEGIELARRLEGWVMGTATSEARAWMEPGQAPVPVVINLSERQLRQGDLASKLSTCAQRQGFDLRDLMVDVDEASLLQGDAAASLDRLRDIGVRVCVQNFAGGLTSLRHLAELPVHAIKVDIALLRPRGANGGSRLADMVSSIAFSLGIAAFANGVASTDDLEICRTMGLQAAQGMALGRPLPIEETFQRAGVRG